MPESDQFVTHVFHEIGMASGGGMSLSALSFSELDAYCRRMKVDLTAWESINIISMSREYCSWLNKGKEKTCASPWNDRSKEAISANNDRIAEQMKSLRGKKKPR